jgi:preprotein translocase subunit SecE
VENKAIGRYVTLAFIGAAILVAFLISRGLHAGFFYAGMEDMAIGGSKTLTLSSLIGGVTAIVAGVVCFRHPDVKRLADEVALELSKVTWPSRQETWAATVVVLATVAISAAYLGVFDLVWSWASNALLAIR